MGAKRAVEGRSRKYDELLLDWNRAHNPNFQEPVKRETKKEKKEKKDRERAEQKARERDEMIKNGIDPDTKRPIGAPPPAKKKKQKKDPPPIKTATVADNMDEDPDAPEDWDLLDSDVEFETVVKAYRALVQRGEVSRPMARPTDAGNFFVMRRERLRGCRDLVANALAGGGGSMVTVTNLI
jgi:SAGA-associated factor 73